MEGSRITFAKLCHEELLREKERDGIGLYAEKRLHSVLKRWMYDDFTAHEQKVPTRDGKTSRFVADILTPSGEIIEIQTGELYPLARKISFYMEQTDHTVTLVHPLVAKNFGLDCEVYCAELNFTKLLSLRLPEATYVPLPKYPGVSRDLSFICDETVTVAEAENTIAAAGGKLLRSVKLFDIYRGTGVPEGKKSLAFSLTLRAEDRTLTDTDSEGVISKVLSALQEKCGISLR